ncbi:MAG: hypothetical protein WBA74_15800 [Cyclobacteriaceae bacterium]
MNQQITNVIKVKLLLIISLLSIGCSISQSKTLYVILDNDNSNEIAFFDAEKTGYYYFSVAVSEDYKRIVRESENISNQDRKDLNKETIEGIPNTMDEYEFKEFMRTTREWVGDCKRCSWASYNSIYFIIPQDNDLHMAIKLTPISVEID